MYSLCVLCAREFAGEKSERERRSINSLLTVLVVYSRERERESMDLVGETQPNARRESAGWWWWWWRRSAPAPNSTVCVLWGSLRRERFIPTPKPVSRFTISGFSSLLADGLRALYDFLFHNPFVFY